MWRDRRPSRWKGRLREGLTDESFGVRSLELPAGGWWVLDARVSHRLAREMFALLHGGDTTAIAHALSCMTVAWGFDDFPFVEAATMVLRDELIPGLRILETTDEAERVFGALVADRIPGDYRDEALTADTGWVWQGLQRHAGRCGTADEVVSVCAVCCRARVGVAVSIIRDENGGWRPRQPPLFIILRVGVTGKSEQTPARRWTLA